MTSSDTNHHLPRLRSIDISPFQHRNEPALLLRDPLQLSGNYMVLSQEMGPALMLLDGTRDLETVRASLLVRFGLPFSADLLEYLVQVLDQNFMLENERSATAHQEALAAYRKAAFRPPMMAGHSYPADPADLRRLFDGYVNAPAPARVNHHATARGRFSSSQPGGIESASEWQAAFMSDASCRQGRGLISPHIDYPRGGPLYAAVWRQAEEMVRSADLVVLLGTDHYGAGDRLTLTRQNYATPFGVLPTERRIVDALAASIGEEAAFAGELRNRGEHSLELVLTWLHYMRDGREVALVPVLTGSFGDFILDDTNPHADATLTAFRETLQREMSGRQALVVASGDLSHVGPAFGGQPLDAIGRERIRSDDAELLAHLGSGAPREFFEAIRRQRDCNNVCGVSPFYLMLRLLGNTEGRLVSYDQCPADGQNTSLVSICGMIFD